MLETSAHHFPMVLLVEGRWRKCMAFPGLQTVRDGSELVKTASGAV